VKRGISCSSLLRLRLATVNTPRNDMEVCLAMTEEGAPHSGKRKMSLRLLVVIASLSHLSLRAPSLTVILTLNEMKGKNLTAQGRLRRGTYIDVGCIM